MLICWIIIIPFLFALTFIILLILVFAITGLFLFFRWISLVGAEESTNRGDMKVPTFYSPTEYSEINWPLATFVVGVVGTVFGGIHCLGWFFIFPSSDEAMLWRVCSVTLTGIAFSLPMIVCPFLAILYSPNSFRFKWVACVIIVLAIIVYVVSRLLLLVEAFISLRHLTPGMLALVKWTSFIPHI